MMTLGRKYQQSSGNPGDPRKVYASQSKVGSLSGCSSSISLCDMIEPPDWEEVSERLLSERDPLAYPHNDVQLVTMPKRIRTLAHVLPDEDLSKCSMFVRDCIRSYTSNYTLVQYKYRAHSGSMCGRQRLAERLEVLQAQARQQYEVDIDPLTVSTEQLTQQFESQSQPSSGRQSVASISSSSSCNETLTPRGSWASLDLRSSSSDPLLPDLFEKRPPEQLDAINEARRLENRASDLLGLYTPYLDEEEAVERRLAAEVPCEVMGHRIMVLCHQLKLELDVEPLFASMALYDAKEKKKLSENFYFNLNSECTRQMLSAHVPHADLSTLSRCAVFDVLNPSADVFLLIRLEKVLQGDVHECVEPYIKDDKNREKVRASAQAACSRLGKYRMPLAWTAVSLMHVLNGSNSLERDGDKTDKDTLSVCSQNSNSLDRKASSSSLEQLRRRAGEVGGSLTRKGSIERRAPPPAQQNDELPLLLDTFKPVGITLTSFFKQEPDKLRDEDMYKFLAEIKRPSSAPKKLKCIPGTLKIEVSPCPDEVKNGLTPELAKLQPYGDDNIRPCKEILPFPLHAPLVPHFQYRSLLYLSPREINLNAYTSRTGSARNITVRIQLMNGEEPGSALPAIFGRSSCPEFSTEAYTTVLYHNKNPSIYDEIKIKLPADLGDQHHLLFTFLHIACQRKPVAQDQEKNVETAVGYSWLPLCRNGKLTCGEWNLPVMQEEPPPNYSYIFPDVLLPGTRWIDNHKQIFSLTLDAHSTVHPLDSNIERFATACEAVQEGNIPPRIGLTNMEAELRASIAELPTANVEVVARYLPVVLDKLLQLLVAPPSLAGQTLNIAQDVFTCLAQVFTDVTNMNEGATCDAHYRSSLITTYIQYQCAAPRPAFTDRDVGLPLPPAVMMDGSCKILHEELALQWVVASGATRDLAMHNSWALFELMIKSMVEYLYWSGAHEAPRKSRFPEHLTDDITTLVNNVTAEIISRYGKNSRLTQSLNNSLAFFLFDLLSIADRGYVLALVRTYCKQMSAKIASLPDAVPLVHYKLSFLRIICSHEHYVSLNLPAGGVTSGAASPAPSAHSHASQSSGANHAALSHEFRTRHYLVGLLLTDLSATLDLQSPVLQCAAVNAVLSLLTAHDADPRLNKPELKARIAALYLPLVGVVMDAYPQLYRGFTSGKDVFLDNEMGQFGQFLSAASPEGEFKQSGRAPFNSETTRNLLMCLVWVLKWTERSLLATCVGEMSVTRVHTLLHIIHLCYKCSEYKVSNSETTRNLLMCLVWVLKWTERSLLATCVGGMSITRVHTLLHIIHLCYKCSEYKVSNSETTRNLLMCLVWVLKWTERSLLATCVGGMSVTRVHTLLHIIHLCYKCSEYKVSNSETTRNLLMCLVWVLKWTERSLLATCVGGMSVTRVHTLLHIIHLCYKCSEYKVSNSETTRNLLMCLVWVLKWTERSLLATCVGGMSVTRVHTLLHIIHLCYKCSEYKGRKEIMKCAQQNVRKTTDIKAKLEDVILGQGSARSDFIMRRKAGSNAGGCKRERWRKDWQRDNKHPAAPSAPPPDLCATLSAEVALALLAALETIVQTCGVLEYGQSVCQAALQVLLLAMQRNQSTSVLQHMLATVRALILKLGWSCSGEELGLCRVVLRHCAALSAPARSHASATLYALMRQHYQLGNNFSRVKMQVTMSLSSLVGTSTTFSEESLRRSLKTILVYAEQDHELQDTAFPEQVKDLVFNLHMILSDTVKMKEFQQDPEMLLDLMHRIARGYQHSPDLRLTWLNNMAQKHMERSNHTEAAMCLIHGAALVAETGGSGGRGAALLARVTHNATDESCADVCASHDHAHRHHELQALLEHAASELMTAGMYETVNEVYKVLIPIAEEHRDYKKLANIHAKLNEAFTRIEQMHGKRVFGSYFRVSFYGTKFGDLDGEEFVYKEHALTKLPEIFSRLENFYGQRFGAENVVIIKDSNIVDASSLDPDKAHLQITYVEPYLEPYELRRRTTQYERNYNIKRFMYATPFTVGGRAHGDIAEQCKRKTILTTAHHFPYVKTRIQVVQRTQIILSPIEVAIEDIQKKINELAAATSQEPADPKMLQMVVQGCIGTTVNQGPLELAQVFLAPVAEGTQPPTRLTNKLRLAFKDFSKKCHDALKKNKNLIGSDQREYQRELERNFTRFTERLAPLIQATPGHVAQLSNGLSKPDYKTTAQY